MIDFLIDVKVTIERSPYGIILANQAYSIRLGWVSLRRAL